MRDVMGKSIGWFVFFVFGPIIPSCSADLTGAHYLHTINCSPSTLHIPQGPYLFSQHWPFTSLTIMYQGEKTVGTCYRDGSLYFTVGNNKVCSGIYYRGQAKLLCRFSEDEHCLIDMKSIDGFPLTCAGRKMNSFTWSSIVTLLLLALLSQSIEK
jgi:hypothetical protein